MGITVREQATASEEPLTLDDVKAHVRNFENDDDAFLTGLISVAREWIETRTHTKLRAFDVDLVFDAFPPVIELPFAPVSSITSITHFDSAGEEQTLATSEYQSDLVSRPHRICPVFGSTWPVPDTRLNAVKVTFVAGYGDGNPAPAAAIHAMKLLIGHWDRNREAVLIGTISKQIEFSVMSLVLPLRVPFA